MEVRFGLKAQDTMKKNALAASFTPCYLYKGKLLFKAALS